MTVRILYLGLGRVRVSFYSVNLITRNNQIKLPFDFIIFHIIFILQVPYFVIDLLSLT